MPLPARTADTMSAAIAISSPNGRMSKRAQAAARSDLRVALFGEHGMARGTPKQPTEIERLTRDAAQFRALAANGMSPRKFIKQAERCEERIATILASA